MESMNCETIRTAPKTSCEEFHNVFKSPSFRRHITKIFMAITHKRLRKSPNIYELVSKGQNEL